MEHLQSELQHTKDLQQEAEQHLVEKTKEAAGQAQEAAEEKSRLNWTSIRASP